MNPESKSKSQLNLLKQPDDKLYLPLQENLDLLATVPIPKDDENNSGPETHNQDENVNVDLDNRIIQLDYTAADNNSEKIPDDWLNYWHNITDGRVFASMSDYYQAFKQLKEKSENGSVEERSLVNKLIQGLRGDCNGCTKKNWLISSTKIRYSNDIESSNIIQHYGCTNPSLTKMLNVDIPFYSDVPISDALSDGKGLNYLRALFDTRDEAECIMRTFEFFSGKQRNEIVLVTPPFDRGVLSTRTRNPWRDSGFVYGTGFRIFGQGFYFVGRSRGVRIINKEDGSQ